MTKRLEGTHLAGFWEFPGGKCEAEETPAACLVREVREELGAGVLVGEELYRTTYTYGRRALELVFFTCELQDEPQPLLGQEIRWVSRALLRTLEFPPADAELIERLAREP